MGYGRARHDPNAKGEQVTTLYIEKDRLDALVRERDEREKRWWFAHPSSKDKLHEAYLAGHRWAAIEATWHDLQHTFVALFAAQNLSRQPVSLANEALGPFSRAAAQRGLLDARKAYQQLSEDELRTLRLFIEGAHSVALLVIQNSNWMVAEVK
ncbi:MAG: hypothetical protein ACOZAA_09610 [Pseudomonadota bacterium]